MELRDTVPPVSRVASKRGARVKSGLTKTRAIAVSGFRSSGVTLFGLDPTERPAPVPFQDSLQAKHRLNFVPQFSQTRCCELCADTTVRRVRVIILAVVACLISGRARPLL
jgi:hypothetical protein